MSLLLEYPYIFACCKILAQNHCYRKLIKTLKLVVDRHAQRLLKMEQDEVLIFAEILHELIWTLHSESTIPLTQQFAESVLNHYLMITQSLLSHHTLSAVLPSTLKLKLLFISLTIYNDYSRFDECEKFMPSAIDYAQSTQSWPELVQLILIRARYLLFTLIDSPKSTADDQQTHPMLDIDRMLQQIGNQEPWQKHSTNTNNPRQATHSKTCSNAKMPEIYRLFFRFLQCAMRMKCDSCTEPAAKLLYETTNDLLRFIDEKPENAVNGGRKRKLNETQPTHDEQRQPRKRQKLNNLQSASSNDDVDNNSSNNDRNATIRDADTCLLINMCALYNLQWIVRNSAFESPPILSEMLSNLSFLTKTNECDVDEQDMTYFERSLLQCFRANRQHNETMKEVDKYRRLINGEWFKTTIIPLLQRTDARYHRHTEHSKLTQYVSWLNIDGLSDILRLLFECMECMHFGAMKDAQHRLQSVQRTLDEHDESEKENETENGHVHSSANQQDFGVATLRFLVWNLSTHLALIEHSKLDENQTAICNMMRYNDEIKQVLKQRYCEQKLFKNTCSVKQNNNSNNNRKKSKKAAGGTVEKSSTMRLHNGSELILFDESENAMKSTITTTGSTEWMETLLNGLKQEESLKLHEFKSFLKMTSTKLHYLSSHVALIIRDKKCTRNQVKRVHRLTQKQTDVTSRFYIRLVLEILKNGIFVNEQQEAQQQTKSSKKRSNAKMNIKPIHDYMKMIFTQRFNTLHALPLVALCAVYAYCKVDEQVLADFDALHNLIEGTTESTKKKTNSNSNLRRKQKKSDKEEKDEEDDDEDEEDAHSEGAAMEKAIRRRITFLKRMLSQILHEKTEGGYCCMVASVLIYLHKLMEKCRKRYESELKEMRECLQNYIPAQWRMIEQQFADCPPIKRAVSRAFKEVVEDRIGNVNMKQQFKENQVDVKDAVIAESIDQAVRRYVVDYHDHLYVAKHA